MKKIIITEWNKIYSIFLSIIMGAVGVFLSISLFGEAYYPLIAVFVFICIFSFLFFCPSIIVLGDKTIKSLLRTPFQKSFSIAMEEISSVSICGSYVEHKGNYYNLKHFYNYSCELLFELKNGNLIGVCLNLFSPSDETKILKFLADKGYNLSLLETGKATKSNKNTKTLYCHCLDFYLNVFGWVCFVSAFIVGLIALFINGFGFFYLIILIPGVVIIFAIAFKYDPISCFKIRLNDEFIISKRIYLKYPFRVQDGWTINLKKVENISFEMYEYLFRDNKYKTTGSEYNMIHFHYKDGSSRYLIRTIFSKKQLFTLLDYCKKYEIDIEKPEMEPDKEKDWIFEYFQNDKSCD